MNADSARPEETEALAHRAATRAIGYLVHHVVRDDQVEVTVGEVRRGHVHLVKADPGAERFGTGVGIAQHPRTHVDPVHLGFGKLERVRHCG